MLKKLPYIFAVIILLAGAYFWATDNVSAPEMVEDNTQQVVASQDSSQAVTTQAPVTSTVQPTPSSAPASPSATAGSYESYSSGKLSKAATGDVVLFFHASWCPTCRALDANITANAYAIPSTLTILKVDYDSESALKQKYGVTYQHTLVQVDAKGDMITKWAGSPTLSAIVEKTQ